MTILAFFGVLLSTYGQEIKVKKGIVYVDENPVVKIDGSGGLFKLLKYTIFSLKDDTLLKIKEHYLTFQDPRDFPISYFEFDFKYKKVNVKKDIIPASEKQVAKYIFGLKPVFLNNNGVDTAALAKFAASKDYTSQIIADSTANFEFERIQKKQLDATTWTRNIHADIELKKIKTDNYGEPGFAGYEVFEIYQDHILIGVVFRKTVTDGQKSYINYYFLKRLNTSFIYAGAKHSFGMIAYLRDNITGMLTNIYMPKDIPGYSTPLNSTNPILDYANHLLQVGCLN